MERKEPSRIWVKITVTMLFLLMILNQSSFFNLKITADSNIGSTRGLSEKIWIQTSEMDFLNGTAENVEITPTGEVKLGSIEKVKEDNFTDESNIYLKDNLIVDKLTGKVKLNLNFSLTYGNDNNDFGNSILQTSDGGYIIAGRNTNNGSDAWLIKTDKFGIELWNKSLGGSNAQTAYDVEQTSDGGYILAGYNQYGGSLSSQFWVVKTDSLGNILWDNHYGGNELEQCYSINKTSDGGYILTGETRTYGNGGNDVWLVKINGTGDEMWNKTFGASSNDHGRCVQQTSDGGYIITGNIVPSGKIYIDVYLIKTDSFGNKEWEKSYGGDNPEDGWSVLQTDDGGYIIAGSQNHIGWIIKTDSSGNELWNRTYNDIGRSEFLSIKKTNEGGYIIVGLRRPPSFLNDDVWLIKIDENGNELWNRTYGGIDYDAGWDVNITSDGGYVIIGQTYSYGAGWSDVWLIKTDIWGNLLESNGELVSTNLLEGQNASWMNSFSCLVSIPFDTGIKVQFSNDTIKWYNSSGSQDGWDILSNGSNIIELFSLPFSRYNLYYKMNFSSVTTETPSLQYIKLSFSKYKDNGIFESDSFDSNTFPYWKTLNWTGNVPHETELKFKIRTSDSLGSLYNQSTFVGPDGTIATYYTTSGQSIWEGHERDRYIQFKAYLSTTNTEKTPVLEELSITYEPIDTDDDEIEDFIDTDDDNDNIPDTWENQYGFDPLNQTDASIDLDTDSLNNLQEFLNETHPRKNDTDGDNLGDGFEVIFSKTEPEKWDTNGNGIGDGLEFIQSKGYLGWIESLPDDWIGMTITWDNYTILVKTNSSVLEGEFDKEEQKLKIKVSGPNGTQGVTEIEVPKSLCEPEDIEIKLDGELINYTITEDETYYFIHIEYNHSVHELSMEFGKVTEVPSEEAEDEKGFLADFYQIALIIAVIIILALLILIIKIKSEKESIGLSEVPPERLKILLEKKYAEGKMTEETYEDIKSLLEKY